MSEVTQLRPGGNDRLAEDVVGYLRAIGREDLITQDADRADGDGGIAPELYAAVLDPGAARMTAQQAAPGHWWDKFSGVSVTAASFAVLLVGVQCVIQAESWRGLAGFGRMIGITGTAAQGVPVTLDGVSVIAALLALKAELSDEASGRERAALYLFTIASATANYWHGSRAGGLGAALYFGGMSLAVTFVFDMLLRQIRRGERRRRGRRAHPLPQFGLPHWIRYPRLTFRAWSLSIRDGHATPREAIDAAKAESLPVLPIDGEALAAMSARDRLAVAFGALGKTDVPTAVAMLREHGAAIDSSHAYKVRNAMLEGGQQ
jgi:hypothetical protein